MKLERRLQKDRSGLSTILIVIVIAAVVVVAAAAAFVVLSKDDAEGQNKLAPGTVLTFEIAGEGSETTMTLKGTYLGQSVDSYFVQQDTISGTETLFSSYSTMSKGKPDHNAEKTGNETIDTIDGEKNLEVWEYPSDGSTVTSYFDPSTEIVYKEVGTVEGIQTTLELKSYEAKWQKESDYKESDAIGKTYEYGITIGNVTLTAEIVCVADCLDDKYGICYDFTNIADIELLYLVSDHPEGLPDIAEDTGETVTISDTIDGPKSVKKWTVLEDGDGMIYYADPESNIIYRIGMSSGGDTISFDLTEKP